MEADDLDNLIADSLGGVQSALEQEKKAAPSSSNNPQDWAKEAVKDLKDGSRPDGQEPPGEEFFSNLVKTFQDENFQKVMAEALQNAHPDPAKEEPEQSGAADAAAAVASAVQGADAPPLAGAPSVSSAAIGGDGAEEFLQNFLKSFDGAVGNDGDFEKSLTTLMTSMLSNELICEPLQQIAEKLEPWLKSQKGLSQTDKSRYEGQLKLYKQILKVYTSKEDPLPELAREEVQRLLTELHSLGQPPEEVMRQVAPKDAEEGGESFEDFVKTMGLDSNLGSAEQDLLKKLTDEPEELTNLMKDMAQGLPEEACKQQ